MNNKPLKVSLILFILMCTLLSGCGLTNAINKTVKEIQEDYTTAKVSKNKAQLTDDEWNEVTDEVYKDAGFWSKVGNNVLHPIKWVTGKGASSYASTHKDEVAAVSQGKLDAKEEEAERQRKEESSKMFNEWFKKNGNILVVGAILIVIILCILLFIFLMSRARKPEPNAVTAPRRPVKQTGDAVVDYNKLLEERCAELGMDVNEALDCYGGSARAAVEGLMFAE